VGCGPCSPASIPGRSLAVLPDGNSTRACLTSCRPAWTRVENAGSFTRSATPGRCSRNRSQSSRVSVSSATAFALLMFYPSIPLENPQVRRADRAAGVGFADEGAVGSAKGGFGENFQERVSLVAAGVGDPGFP